MSVFKNIQKCFFSLLLLQIFFSQCYGQKKDSLHVALFSDVYLSATPSLSEAERAHYVANYHRFNKPEFNFSAATFHYTSNHFRTSLGLMAGTYTDRNMLSEEPSARNIYEASIGYRFTSDEDIWLDVGVLPSHIGFESVPAQKNWSGSRSLVADLSPYYETGLRLSYRPNESWYFSILALNGWQRITVPLERFGESWGMQVTWQPEPNWLINSSSFIGRVPSSKEGTTRMYSNLYTTLQLNPRMWVMAGWDWGMQDNRLVQWNDLLLQYRYAFAYNKFFGNFRYEYLSDPSSIFRPDLAGIKNRVHLTSLNFDYLLLRKCMLRAEMNYQISPDKIFNTGKVNDDRLLSFLLVASVQLDYIK